jgi:hypothetical protein
MGVRDLLGEDMTISQNECANLCVNIEELTVDISDFKPHGQDHMRE